MSTNTTTAPAAALRLAEKISDLLDGYRTVEHDAQVAALIAAEVEPLVTAVEALIAQVESVERLWSNDTSVIEIDITLGNARADLAKWRGE